MTDGGVDRRDQLIMWAMGEASLLRRQAKHAEGTSDRSEPAWDPSEAERGSEATLGGSGADCGGLVVDWQMPGDSAPTPPFSRTAVARR